MRFFGPYPYPCNSPRVSDFSLKFIVYVSLSLDWLIRFWFKAETSKKDSKSPGRAPVNACRSTHLPCALAQCLPDQKRCSESLLAPVLRHHKNNPLLAAFVGQQRIKTLEPA